jgi:hypothetical protein
MFRRLTRHYLLAKAKASANSISRSHFSVKLAQCKIFPDLKDDPSALPLANTFLRKHPEMSNESVYWHIHDLSPAPGS